MNNEPVALMTEYGIKPLYESALQEGMFLYAHPAKTLTDEDFDAVCLENKRLTSENEALKFHIKWLEGGEEIDTKPVAYMSVYLDDDGDKTTLFCGHKDEFIKNQIPLYTHPAKELAEDLEGAKLVILKLNDMLRQQQSEIEALKAKLAQADRVYDFDNPLLNSDDVGFKQIELNAELLRKAQDK